MSLEAARQAVDDAVLKPTRVMYAKKPVAVVADPSSDARTVAKVKVASKLTVTPARPASTAWCSTRATPRGC